MRCFISLIMLVVIATGCKIGPDYRRPAVDIPAAWRFENKETQDLINTSWWEQFNDPVLNELIAIALKENKDLQIATARVEEYLGYYGETRSALFPQIGASASAARERVTEEGRTSLPAGVNPIDRDYQGLISASWELDIWGKLRRATEAARADLLSSVEARSGVILTLVAGVANTYIDLRRLDRELEIALRTAKTREETYQLFKLRFDGGVISDLELSQVASEYEDAMAAIPQIEKEIGQVENALCVLLGRNPAPIRRGKSIDELVPPAVPAGLPSELLERRPDIRQAEEDLIAANARIGVARGLYFPTISLTGFNGTASAEFDELFSGPASIWNYGGQLTVPIFTAGGIAGIVKASEAVQQQALARYRQAIENGFREFDDSLIDQQKSRERLAAQSRQVSALRTYAGTARLRFDEGYTSFIEVLDAERSLFNVERSYTQTQAALLQSLVNLYKTMGGGWVIEADRMTADNAAAPSGEVDKSSSSQ
jgi:multidrug efflux system outer membrane protein